MQPPIWFQDNTVKPITNLLRCLPSGRCIDQEWVTRQMLDH